MKNSVLITGASRGLGLEFVVAAQRFHRAFDQSAIGMAFTDGKILLAGRAAQGAAGRDIAGFFDQQAHAK